jgi:hypothetical protein
MINFNNQTVISNYESIIRCIEKGFNKMIRLDFKILLDTIFCRKLLEVTF